MGHCGPRGHSIIFEVTGTCFAGLEFSDQEKFRNVRLETKILTFKLTFPDFPLSGDSKTIKDAPVTFITENKAVGPLCVVEMKGGNHPPITLWWRVAAFKYGLWEIPV